MKKWCVLWETGGLDDSPSCLTSFLISFVGINLCFQAFRIRGVQFPHLSFYFF